MLQRIEIEFLKVGKNTDHDDWKKKMQFSQK